MRVVLRVQTVAARATAASLEQVHTGRRSKAAHGRDYRWRTSAAEHPQNLRRVPCGELAGLAIEARSEAAAQRAFHAQASGHCRPQRMSISERPKEPDLAQAFAGSGGTPHHAALWIWSPAGGYRSL